MNIKFTTKQADSAFNQALIDSQVVKNWFMNRVTGYDNVEAQVTLEINIDPWTKTEKPSFDWAIYSQPIDEYGLVENGNTFKNIINGGLIYRGDDNYSSHT